MACPYFEPSEPWEEWRDAPRLPLGAPYRGWCVAGGRRRAEETQLRQWCSFGYARGCCPHFPPEAPADAARFEGQVWVLEKDGAPVAHGRLNGASAAAVRMRRVRQQLERSQPWKGGR